MEWCHQLDLSILRFVNQEGANAFLDWFFPIMAAPSYFMVPMILVGLFLLWKGGMRGRLFVLLMGIALLIGDAGIVNTIKKRVNRPRPHEAVEGVRLVTQHEVTIVHPTEIPKSGRSFPSGHVCNNVALAVIGVAIYGRRFRWLYLWALLMAWNRVYLGSHYPSDVFFSWLLSFGYSSLIVAGFYAVLRKQGKRWDAKEGIC